MGEPPTQAGAGADAFTAEDFDPAVYLNELFPTEQSLCALEEAAASMGQLHSKLNQQRQRAIADQVGSKELGQRRLVSAKAAIHSGELVGHHISLSAWLTWCLLNTASVFDQVGQIQTKTRQTEATVEEICCDIRQLDAAKQNLTATVTSLRRLQMLIQAVDKLQSTTSARQYRAAAGLLDATNELAVLFKDFRAVPKVADLHRQTKEARENLRRQVISDIKRVVGDHDKYFDGQSLHAGGDDDASHVNVPALHHQALADACCVVASMGATCKEELLTWFCHQQLHPYHTLFSDAGADADAAPHPLEHTEKRYSWLLRHLHGFDERYSEIFPAQWDVKRQLCLTFCASTREHFDECPQLRAAAG